MTEQKKQINTGKLCPQCLVATRCMEAGEPGAPRLQPGRRAMVCPRCGAYVYCHPLTSEALGSVADAPLRRLRWQTHQVFDLVWKLRLKRSRYNAYSWLSLRLGLSKDVAHMGLFDEDTCRRAIAICAQYIRKHRPEEPLPAFCGEFTCPAETAPQEKRPPR